MNQTKNGLLSAMDVNPSSSQSLNQNFIKSTTSKVFAFLLSCALKQRLQGDALDDCVAHIQGKETEVYNQFDVAIEEFWALRLNQEQNGIDFRVFQFGVREEEKVALILELGFQVVHQRKKKKWLSELGQMGRMKDNVSEEKEEEGAVVRIRARK